MRAVSLFSGAGGMDAGFAAAGIHAVAANDRNAEAVASYRANFGVSPILGDAADYVGRLPGAGIDVVFGGPPCQAFSIAGHMDPADPRAGLVHVFMDAVERVRPSFFVMENVSALARLAKWRPLRDALEARARALGYGTAVFVANARDHGVAQSRERMFMLGAFGRTDDEVGTAVAAGLAARRAPAPSVGGIVRRLGPAGSPTNRITSPARITYCRRPVLRASPYAGMMFNGAGRPVRAEGQAPTLTATMGGNRTHIVDEGEIFGGDEPFVEIYHRELMAGGAPRTGAVPARLRRLTVAECLAIQGFPEGWRISGAPAAQYRQIGNAVPPQLARAVAGVLLDLAAAGVARLAA